MISLETILGATLQNPKALGVLREAVTSDLTVKNPHYRTIMQWVVDFYDQYGKLPTDNDASMWVMTLNENRQAPVRSAWNELSKQDVSGYTLEFLAETGLKELRDVAARNASRMMASMGDEVDPEVLSEFSRRVEEIRPVELTNVANLSDVSKWAIPESRDYETYWPSGIPKLDRYIRGFKNELVFVIAESGKGKSSLLVNFGRAAALEGAKVFHLSLELDLHATTQRYYRRISESPQAEYNEKNKEVQRRLEKWFRLARGSIHTKYDKAYNVTVDDIKGMVNLFADKNDGVDIFILDYLDLVKRTRAQERLPRDEQERRLSHEIRTIATEHECSVISAGQINVKGYGKENLSLSHMGGGIAKSQAADMIFGLVQTEEQAAINQGRLQILKVRENSGKGGEIPLYINLDRMMITDLDDPDARRTRMKLREESING